MEERIDGGKEVRMDIWMEGTMDGREKRGLGSERRKDDRRTERRNEETKERR